MREIIGHKPAIDILIGALGRGRMPHAWVFHGPVGVGKFKTAKCLAKILLCANSGDTPHGSDACGHCDSCVLLGNQDQTGHPDLHVVRKELARYSDDATIRSRKLASIPVEVLRSYFLDPVYRAPQLGQNKVFIIDEAELLSAAGQNLMLKTLEEPPPGTYIFLIAGDSASLLPTVRSRCRMLPFGPVTDEQVESWIRGQDADLSDQQQSWLVGFAGGSLGRAQLAVEYGLHEWDTQIRSGLDAIQAGRYPASLGAVLAKCIGDFSEQWVKAHDNASKDAANKLGAGFVLSLFAYHARKALEVAARECDVGDPGDADGLEIRTAPWLDVVDALRQVEGEIQAGVNMGLALDHLVSLAYRSLSGGGALVATGR